MEGDIRRLESYMQELPQRIRQSVRLALERAGAEGVSKLSELFKTEGKSLSVEWPPLKEKYLRWKLKKGFSEKVLHRTTTLRQSFNSKVNDYSAIIGTPVKYAIYHEYGTKKMPARPFMKPVAEYLSGKALSRIFRSAFEEAL